MAGLRQFNLNQLVRPKLCWYNYCHYIESYWLGFWLARYEYFQRVNWMLRYNYIWLYDCELRLRARLLSNLSWYSFHHPDPSLWRNNYIHVEHDPLICVNSRKHCCYLRFQFEWSGNFQHCCNSKSKHKWHHYLVPILNCCSQLYSSQFYCDTKSIIDITTFCCQFDYFINGPSSFILWSLYLQPSFKRASNLCKSKFEYNQCLHWSKHKHRYIPIACQSPNAKCSFSFERSFFDNQCGSVPGSLNYAW